MKRSTIAVAFAAVPAMLLAAQTRLTSDASVLVATAHKKER